MVKKKKGQQVEEAYQALLKKIITLEIEPGQFLNEKNLMAEMGIGRTPLREAVVLLKRDNLVESQPNKSSYVKELTLSNVKDLFESLIVVEKNVTYLAARRASPAQQAAIEEAGEAVDEAIRSGDSWQMTSRNLVFHRLIAEASGNSYLIQFHLHLRKQAERLSYIAVSRELGDDSQTLDEHNRKISAHHQELVRCLKEGDLAGAEATSIENIKLFQGRILRYLNEIDYV
ncbi:MAG: GntR family transcriptional regulator [Deltaproteobacteria bacterium]|nr:GntR family transcriptional regulator [Deltaproteobacteria bacterium]